MKTSNYYNEIIQKIDTLSKREYASFCLSGIQLVLIGIVQIFIGISFLELFGNFSPLVRTVLMLFFLIISIGLFSYLFLIPFLKYLKILSRGSYHHYALKVGAYFPQVKDELLNAMQLVEIIESKNSFSGELRDAAFKQVYNKTHSVNFAEAVSFNQAKKVFRFFLGSLVLATLLIIFVPGLQNASGRILRFNREFVPPAKFSFQISPGNKEVTKGQEINIAVRVIGPTPAYVNIAIKYKEQTEFEYKDLTIDSSGLYRFSIPVARSSFEYFIKAEDVSSDIFNIRVIDKPVIKNLDLKIIPPAYSKQAEINQQDNGNVTSLTGSQMQFLIATTKENLKSAKLFFDDSTEFQLKLQGRNALGTYRIKKDENYRIIITDKDGNQNENPVTYSIKALTDAFPSIEIVEPNKNVNLGNDDRLPLLLKISDDYGFTNLKLHYRLSSSRYEKPKEEFSSQDIQISKSVKEEDINYVWNLSSLNLGVEDVVTYYLEIFDNDNVSGPKSAKTGTFTVRVPSLDELFAEADKSQDAAEKKLMESLKEAEKLKDNLEKINQDLKQDKKEITWQEKERIEKTLDQFENLQNKIDDAKKDLSRMQNEMQKNNLLSQETLEKYMELQKLFDELSSEEMKQAMEKLQDLLQKMNRDQIQNATENMKVNEEMMKKSIERTLELLKRVQVEQKMDEIQKRLDNLTNKLDELQKQTNRSDLSKDAKKNELGDKQKDVTEDLQNLEEKMKDLQDKMKEFDEMPNNEMNKAVDEMQKQQNEEMSKDAQQQLQKGQKQQAMQNQSQMSKNMNSMKQMISSIQQQMEMQNQRVVFNQMMKALDNILTLSKEQEELKNQSKELDPNSSLFNENAKQQNNLERNMDKIINQLNELSKKTFAITPEMAKALGEARNSMRQSTGSLQNRNGSLAQNQQGEAMKSLNEAAGIMKGSMENMMDGGGSGGGMLSMMQQLQKMSGQQMDLNNMTQQLQQGQMSMQQQAEFQRLAMQQEVIRKSLEELNNEAKQTGQSKKLPANLDKVLEDMQEVVSDMNTRKLDDDLIQKQERILSKLLDAQRSINERDFEKQRESSAGQKFVNESPAELNLNSSKGKNKIKDELNKAVNEGYAKDYEALIRKYYEALGKDIPH